MLPEGVCLAREALLLCPGGSPLCRLWCLLCVLAVSKLPGRNCCLEFAGKDDVWKVGMDNFGNHRRWTLVEQS